MMTNNRMKFKYLTIILILFIVLSIFVPKHVIAKDYGTPQLTTIRNRDGRILYAKEIASFFKKIDEYIPSLSPSQSEWIKKELEEYKKTKNFNRYIEITKSKEYKMDSIKGHLATISRELNLLINSKHLKKEVYYWSIITEELMRVDFWSTLHILIEEHGLVNKKLFYSESIEKIDQYTFYLNNGILPAELIIGYILQPYLLDSELLK